MTPQEDSQQNVHAFFRGPLNRPEVIAHRGGGGEWPGETLFAFERALDAGADVLEMDAHATSDGHIVLMHNKTVEHTTDGRGKIKELTLAQIKELDAGYRWTADGFTFPFRSKPGPVPDDLRVATLEEVFERFKGRRTAVRLNVEIKQKSPSIAKRLYELIVKHGMEERVLVACGPGGPAREFREIAKGRVATSATVWEMIKFRWLKHIFGGKVEGLGYEAIQTSSTAFLLEVIFLTPEKPRRLAFITRGYLETARRFGLPVHGWTVNHPDEMARLTHLGVDGIITDYPTALVALLGRKRSDGEQQPAHSFQLKAAEGQLE